MGKPKTTITSKDKSETLREKTSPTRSGTIPALAFAPEKKPWPLVWSRQLKILSASVSSTNRHPIFDCMYGMGSDETSDSSDPFPRTFVNRFTSCSKTRTVLEDRIGTKRHLMLGYPNLVPLRSLASLQFKYNTRNTSSKQS